MSYLTLGFSFARSLLANLDKASTNGKGNVIHTPFGTFHMYHRSAKRGRFFSISGSTIFHNGGSYKMSSFRRMFKKWFF